MITIKINGGRYDGEKIAVDHYIILAAVQNGDDLGLYTLGEAADPYLAMFAVKMNHLAEKALFDSREREEVR